MKAPTRPECGGYGDEKFASNYLDFFPVVFK